MITVKQAKKLKIGDILYHIKNINKDGSPQRWKVNGIIKFWKTRPDEFRIPVKHGLYTYDYVDHNSNHLVYIPKKG